MSVAAVARRVDALQAELIKLRNEIPSAIAQGIRVHADRPAGELGAPSLRFGTIDGVFEDEGYATVVLDGQTESVPVMMLGGLLENERVAVMFYPDGGSLALGMVNPATVPPISGVPAGGTGGQALVKIDGTDYNDAWADVVHSVVAGTNVTVDNTDPQNPIVSSAGTGTPVSKTTLYSDNWATITSFSGSWVGLVEWPTARVSGDALLDFVSGPLGAKTPVVLADGLYTFNVEVSSSNDTDAFEISLNTVRPPSTPLGSQQFREFFQPNTGASPPQILSISLTTAMLAGDYVGVQIGGGGTADIAITATVSMSTVIGGPLSSGFPLGPFDDSVGTHEVLTATSGGIISAMIGRTTSDSAPTESAYWQVAISDALGAASFGGKGTAPDGSYGEVSVGGLGSAYGSVSLVAQGNGAASPAILTMLSHVSGGASEIDFSSDTVEFDANTGITFNTPVFQIHGAIASPTIGTASEFAFWLDDTPGATVLHFKAKDSGGTVRNGSIALT